MDDKVKRYARYLLIMAGLGGLIYGIDVGVCAAAYPYIEKTSDFTKAQLGLIVGAVLWGSVVSSLFAGSLSEWFGRKIIIIVSALFFTLSIPVICALTPDNSRRGVLLQVTFRSNYALIGIALATELFPDGGIGAAVATLLSAFIIPIFNILAVICLTVFSSSHESPSIKKVLLGIIKNPLIIGVLLGAVMLGAKLVLRSNGISFALEDITPVWKTLNYLSTMATPIALVALGAQFEFSAIAGMKRELIFGVAMRGIIIPALALTAAYLLGTFNGPHFATFVAVFCTPIAVSSVPMAQEMGADTSLAGQLVVWTTIFSAITIFATSFILKELGAFAI